MNKKTAKSLLALLLALCLLLGSVAALAEGEGAESDEITAEASEGNVTVTVPKDVSGDGSDTDGVGVAAVVVPSPSTPPEVIIAGATDEENQKIDDTINSAADSESGISSITVDAKDVIMTGSEDTDYLDLTGVGAIASGGVDVTVNAGNVTVNTEDHGLNAHGVDAMTNNGSKVSVTAGDIDAKADNEAMDAFGIYIQEGNGRNPGKVSVTADSVNAVGWNAYGITDSSLTSSDDIVVKGDVLASGTTADGMSIVGSAYPDQEPTKSVSVGGDVVATSRGRASNGISSESYGVDLEITVGGDVSGKGNGIASITHGSDALFAVGGNVTGESGYGIRLQCEEDYENPTPTQVTVLGDVTGGETGISIAAPYGTAMVIVDGTVKGGEDRAAIEFMGNREYNESTVGYFYTVGAVGVAVWEAVTNAKDEVARIIYNQQTRSARSRTSDSDGALGGVYDSSGSYLGDSHQYNAVDLLRNTVAYIVKVQDDWKEKLSVTKTVGNEGISDVAEQEADVVKLGEDGKAVLDEETGKVTKEKKTFQLAREDDFLKLDVNLDEDEETLEGVYYNAERDEEALQAVDATDEGADFSSVKLVKDEDGNFWVRMLRGGAMLLGLKTHKHNYDDGEKINVKPATCTEDGSYDLLLTCKDCGHQKTEKNKVIKKLGHNPGDPVKENEVPATCTEDGSYDEVVYCSVCGKKLSTTPKTIDKLGHTPDDPVKENEVPATCAKEGSYDEVVYCSVCGKKLSTTPKTTDKQAHTPDDPTIEVIEDATCTEVGSHDEVVYCAICGKELSRETLEDPATGHEPRTPVKENEVPATLEAPGKYDSVVYCAACGLELSRTEVIIPQLTAPEEKKAEEEPVWVLVYVPVDDEVSVNGVKAEDHPGMAKAMQAMGDSLDGEAADGASVTVTFKNAEKLMNPDELARFNSMSVKERMMVFQHLLGFGVDPDDALNEAAKALLADVEARVAEMTDDEKAERAKQIDRTFLPRLVVVDQAEHESVGIELIIDRAGKKSYERYTFFDDEGEWKLFRIEDGVFVKV